MLGAIVLSVGLPFYIPAAFFCAVQTIPTQLCYKYILLLLNAVQTACNMVPATVIDMALT
jgi:hypothetical protein